MLLRNGVNSPNFRLIDVTAGTLLLAYEYEDETDDRE